MIEVVIGANVDQATAGINKVRAEAVKLQHTLETLQAKVLARKDFLRLETDPTKIARFNKEIASLETQIVNIKNIGKAGFDELGNAILQPVGPLKKVSAGASIAWSNLRQLAYALPGIGIAWLVGGLVGLVSELFNTASGFSKAEIASGHFENALERIKKSADDLKDSLDFSGTIAKLKLELAGVEGADLKIAGSNIDVKNAITLIGSLDNKIKGLKDINAKLFEDRLKQEHTLQSLGKKPSALANLFIEFGDIDKIPQGLIQKASKQDQALIKSYQDATKTIEDLQKQREKIRQAGIKSIFEGGVAQVQEQKKIHDKDLKAWEEYLKKLKEIQERWDDIIREVNGRVLEFINSRVKSGFLNPRELFDDVKGQIESGNINIFLRPLVRNPDGSISTIQSMSIGVDGKEVLIPMVADNGKIMSELEAIEQFRKSGKHLGIFEDIKSANAYAEALHKVQEALFITNKLILKPLTFLSTSKPLEFDVKNLSDIGNQIADITAQIEFLTQAEQRIPGITSDAEIKRLREQLELLKKIQAAFPQVGGAGVPSNKSSSTEGLSDEDKEFLRQARNISNTIVPAINQMIEAIGRGENAFKAFGSAVKSIMAEVAQKIISTAILAGILTAITGGTFAGAKGFGAIFAGLLGGKFAEGGVVPGGFPNDSYPALLSSHETVLTPQQLSGLLNSRGNGTDEVNVNVFGDGLLLFQARGQRRQLRSFGR